MLLPKVDSKYLQRVGNHTIISLVDTGQIKTRSAFYTRVTNTTNRAHPLLGVPYAPTHCWMGGMGWSPGWLPLGTAEVHPPVTRAQPPAQQEAEG